MGDILLVKSKVKKKSSIFGFRLHCPLLQYLFKPLENHVVSEFRLRNRCGQRLSLLLPAPSPTSSFSFACHVESPPPPTSKCHQSEISLLMYSTVRLSAWEAFLPGQKLGSKHLGEHTGRGRS